MICLPRSAKAQAFALVTSNAHKTSAFGYGSNKASFPPARRNESKTEVQTAL